MDATLVEDLAASQARATAAVADAIAASIRGDRRAFDRLIEPRLPRTYRIALGVLGSEADARDAVQDAQLSAWRQLPSLREVERFDAWVDRIVVNACRMVARQRHRVREIPIADDFDATEPRPGPEDVAERQAIERAFDRLPVDQRAILVLHHVEQRPLASIADLLGIPVGTAKSRLHAARAAFERRLEHER